MAESVIKSRKFIQLTENDFTWNNSAKGFYSNSFTIDKNSVLSASAVATNGAAVMGLYIRANGEIVVIGYIPSNNSSIDSAYTFRVYIEYK